MRSIKGLNLLIVVMVSIIMTLRAHAEPTLDVENVPLQFQSNSNNLIWKNEIEPLLDRECVKCHGPLKRKGGLNLSTFQSLLVGGDSGAALIPGNPQKSPLLLYVQPGSEPHMPPKKQLADEDLKRLETWIAHLSLTEKDPSDSTEQNSNHASSRSAPQSLPQSLDGFPVHHAINAYIRSEWQARGLVPSPPCDDRTFIRRAYLDLIGHGPSQEDILDFLFDSRPNKRQVLVRHLLSTDLYAKNMAETFDLLLLGRKEGKALAARRNHGWLSYLESVFAENRPWNEALREIIIARQPDKADTNRAGALWFVYEQRNNHQAIAESIAPMAFGTQIKCAQCHDHPLAHEIKQAHYWGMVAAFNRSQNVETDSGIGVAESAIGGFINFANLKQESQPAKLFFLNGTSVDELRPNAGEEESDSPTRYVIAPAEKDQRPQKASVPIFSRREALAKAVTENNPLLARAFVNHIWALMIGRGLVHPFDEINSKHQPSHPELLAWLSQRFESSGFDIKQLIEGIILSDPYQLSSTATTRHLQNPDAFAYGIEKPLKAETLYRLLLAATGHAEASYQEQFPDQSKRLKELLRKYFPDLLPEVYQATLQQAMFLSNSPEIDHLLEARPGNTADRLLAIDSSEQRITEGFLAILGRSPTPEEQAYLHQFLTQRNTRPSEGLSQFLWSLIASPEFQLNR